MTDAVIQRRTPGLLAAFPSVRLRMGVRLIPCSHEPAAVLPGITSDTHCCAAQGELPFHVRGRLS